MKCRYAKLVVLLAIQLTFAPQAEAKNQTDPLQRAAASWRSEVADAIYRTVAQANFDELNSELDSAASTFLERALFERGHTMDLSFVQGCDLGPPAWLRWGEIARAAIRSRSPDHFEAVRAQVVRDAARFAAISDQEHSSDIHAELRTRVEMDQQVRLDLDAPIESDDEVAIDAILGERMIRACEIDIQNGEWLKRPEISSLLENSPDSDVILRIVTLALHADHLPTIQQDFANTISNHDDERIRALSRRLEDRSRINRGLNQFFGTGVICEGVEPVLIGSPDLELVNANRSRAGMLHLDLSELRRGGFCGG